MRALIASHPQPHDPLSALELVDRAEPTPPPGWEVIDVRAAALNQHDLATLRGIANDEKNLPIVLGSDAAGVTADGREVLCHAVVPNPGVAFADDADVFGSMSILSEYYDGTHAQRLAVPSVNLLDKPAGWSFAEAAFVPTAWLTAYRMLFVKAQARPGDRVLVQGAGGGVSTAAIVLARAAGLTVYVTSREESKRARALELGAREAFASGQRLPERVEIVIETVGKATFAHSIKSLQPGGVLVVSGATTGFDPPAELNHVFAKQLRIVGASMGTRRELIALIRMLEETGNRPLVAAEYALEDGHRAYEQLRDGEVFGKIILRM